MSHSWSFLLRQRHVCPLVPGWGCCRSSRRWCSGKTIIKTSQTSVPTSVYVSLHQCLLHRPAPLQSQPSTTALWPSQTAAAPPPSSPPLLRWSPRTGRYRPAGTAGQKTTVRFSYRRPHSQFFTKYNWRSKDVEQTVTWYKRYWSHGGDNSRCAATGLGIEPRTLRRMQLC